MKTIVATIAGLAFISPALAQPAPSANAAQPICSANAGDGCVVQLEPDATAANNAIDILPPSPDQSYEPVTEHSNSMIFSGMGGPIDERTDYPPCRRGAGDDNCIQLYERGVTGAGN